jgi:hypothetical protein
MLLVLHTNLDMLFYRFYQVLPHNITSASFARRIDCVIDQFNRTAPFCSRRKKSHKDGRCCCIWLSAVYLPALARSILLIMMVGLVAGV